MRNFGEELTYWYLRLNGFFLVDDFVLHSTDLKDEHNADVDTIGIRHPHTIENIGMCDVKDISSALLEFEPDIQQKIVVVFSEVKSGDYGAKINLERPDRLEYILKRTGLLEEKHLPTVLAELISNKRFQSGGITFLKIIFSHVKYNKKDFYYLPLNYVEQQIKEKLKKYMHEKNSAKFFFPSTLMQYLIWKVREEGGYIKKVRKPKRIVLL